MSLLAVVLLGIAISYVLSKFIRWIFYPALKKRPADTPDNADTYFTAEKNGYMSAVAVFVIFAASNCSLLLTGMARPPYTIRHPSSYLLWSPLTMRNCGYM